MEYVASENFQNFQHLSTHSCVVIKMNFVDAFGNLPDMFIKNVPIYVD